METGDTKKMEVKQTDNITDRENDRGKVKYKKEINERKRLENKQNNDI